MEAAVGLTLCLILSAAVGPSASLPPPLPAPTPPSPQPCQLPNGTVMAEVIPGGTWSSGPMCASCNCPAAGGIMTCYPLPCQRPQCSNPQFPPGGYMCCGTCPPPPPPTTTAPPQGPSPQPCKLPNGNVVPEATPGEYWSSGYRCAACNCPAEGGIMECYPPPCPQPQCSNPQFPPEGIMCCGTCPDQGPPPSTPPPPTTAPPQGPSPQPCKLPNGTVMAEVTPGGTWSSGPMCAPCNCPPEGGIMECFPLPCQPPCPSQQYPPGGYMCCGTCPPPPPPTTTPPPPPPPTTTAPNGCWYSNGTQVPNVLPGGSFSLGSSCGYCDCAQSGLVTCYAPPCVRPPCVDPQSNGPYCCGQCPNGPNCHGPGGVIVQGQQTVDGMVCQCQMDYSGPGGPPMAECVPIPTTLPPGCRDYGGDIILDLFPGGHWQSADGCRHCECDQSGQAMCYHEDCGLAMCVDRESVPGQCCDTCPNGFNCKTPQDTVIAMHQSIVENGMNCSCPIFDPGYGMGSPGGGGANPQAVCFPQAPTTLPPPTTLPHPTTPPPPAGCRLYNGTVLKGVKPGDKVDLGPCKFCNCGERWEVYCAVYRCARAPCSNAVVPKGKCCSECPNGPDCTRSDGSVVKNLKPGDRVTNGCETCTCDKYGKAMCYWMACMMPLCADAVVPKGGCCAKCPNGENCKLKSGKLLPVGKTVKENGVSCTCVKDKRSYSVALRCKSLWLPVLYPAPVKSYVQPKLLITFD